MSGREDATDTVAQLDHAACGLLKTADDGTFLRVNRTFCSWVGYSAEELIRRRRLQELLTMGGRIFHQTHWMPLLQMQGSISEVKLEIVHGDGTKIPMVVNALRREEGGAMVHEVAAFVARDRDKYERELLQSRKRLEDLVAEATRLQAEAKDRALFAEQMIGIVSHDLRNPLAAVAMGTAILERGELSESHLRTVSRIRRASDRATRLIADLLDFTQARIGNGLSVTRESIDVHAVIAEAVDELAHLYPARMLKHVRLGAGACAADANRLVQLVGNLVSNAVAYGAPEKPVTVTSEVEPGSCAISVHNCGAPIPPEAQARIFEAMTRGPHATGGGRSVGLGLYIVSEIAKAHGGRAAVTSTLGSGTTFRAAIPR